MEVIVWTLFILYVICGLVTTASYNYLRNEGKVWKTIWHTILIVIPMSVVILPIVVGMMLGQKLFNIVSEEYEEENNQ